MKVSILKRLEALENVVNKTETPDLIMVTFDENIDKYIFDEHYHNKDINGKAGFGEHRNTRLLEHYREYVFSENVHAPVIFIVNNEDEIISASFNTDNLRKKCGLSADTAFYIDSINYSNVIATETEVNICVYESNNK